MDQQAQVEMLAKYEALLAKRNPATDATLFSISGFLLNSEYELILFMARQKIWTGTVPPPPAGFQTGDGSIELGLFLYWFNNPSLIQSLLLRDLIILVKIYVPPFPLSQMTLVNYNYLNNNELVYDDGSILSTETYATFDQGWFGAFINLLITDIGSLWYNDGKFPMKTPPSPVVLKGATVNMVNIALVGDWGAGNTAAVNVMNQITTLSPKVDYIIHLGDVYYGGTPLKSDPQSWEYFNSGEENSNFVDLWPGSYTGKSFTLNSNHEMYSGANGLFYDALIPQGSPFSAQQGTSCFLLQYAGWNILGLDSAFNGTSIDAFMSGNLGGSAEPQVNWIRSLNLNPAKTIVLTHHTGFEYDASAVDDLWAQVKSALGGDPYAWYWGHAHNGIVYTNPVSIPVPGGPNFTTKTYARCTGHGSLPYSKAVTLVNNKNVLWQAATPLPKPSTQVYNGFVMLTLQSANNQITGITENFYDWSSGKPMWSKKIF